MQRERKILDRLSERYEHNILSLLMHYTDSGLPDASKEN